MTNKTTFLALSAIAGLAVVITSLNAADATAPAAASGSAAPKPAAAKASASAPAGSASKIDLSKLPKASDKKGLTYDKDILPALKASCSGCHIGSARPSGGLDLSTLAAALKGGRSNKDKDIVPGHGDQSFILLYTADLVAKSEMPPLNRRTTGNPPHPALTKDQLADLRAWIDQGAK